MKQPNSTGAGALHHRNDIDGLRAVAVLSVIVFHAGASWLPGGFAGVDVFFVISGFLITRLLLAEQARAGRISLIGFWERRIRRILPALFAVMAVCCVAAWALMMPIPLREFSYALRGASMFAANIALADLTDYFAGPADLQPLLHLWSLGVEEQYYLLFPPLAALCLARAPRRFPAVLALLLALSFGAAAWGVAETPENAFFLPHMRAWQLLTGALLATGVMPRMAPRTQAAVGVLGAAMLAATFVLLPGGAGYPGVPALLPTAGAALVIMAGGRGPVGAVLSLRPVVGIGLISYSLYLWHWPLLVFPRVAAGGAEGAPVVLPLIASFALAWASWRFIERPFRRKGGVLPTRGAYAAAALGATLFLGVGYAGKLTDGAPWRFSAEAQRMLEVRADYQAGEAIACSRRSTAMVKAPSPRAAAAIACRVGAPNGKLRVALRGDSIGMAMQPAIDAAVADLGIRALMLARAGCPLLLQPRAADRAKSRVCAEFTELVPRIAQDMGIDVMVISGLELAALADDRDWVQALSRMVEGLVARGIHAVILPPPPSVDFNVPEALAHAIVHGAPKPRGQSAAVYDRRLKPLREAVAAMPEGTIYVDLAPAFCPAGQTHCRLTDDAGSPVLADRMHPSAAGAALVAPLLKQALAQALSAIPD